MPTENCTSSARLLHCASKKRRISPEGNPNRPDPPISKLGDDVLVDILIRLPDPRSASRCKSVCKRWSSVIFSPRFNRLFVSRHQSRSEPPLLLPSIDFFSLSILLNFLPVPERTEAYFHVCDSFKDLVLCGFGDADGPNGQLGRTFIICNPFSKQWVALPLAPVRSEGYFQMVARLVCEPVKSIDLDLGDGQSYLHSEYRFRVVCMYLLGQTINMDVFCSNSGEWTSNALVLDGFLRLKDPYVISWNGELVWACRKPKAGAAPLLARFNPFRLDIPPVYTDVSELLPRRWNISVSQGAFHIVEFDAEAAPVVRVRVWRLEEDRESWRHYKVSLNTMMISSGPRDRDDYDELERCSVIGLHPANPEIVFLYYPRPLIDKEDDEVLTCNLSNGELGRLSKSIPGLRIFQPAVSCWPTPIPRYKELQDMYAGSYKCWVQRGGQVATPLKAVLDLVRSMRETPEHELAALGSLSPCEM